MTYRWVVFKGEPPQLNPTDNENMRRCGWFIVDGMYRKFSPEDMARYYAGASLTKEMQLAEQGGEEWVEDLELCEVDL